MEKHLPKYFVVERDSSEEFKQFAEYVKRKYNKYILSQGWLYYGNSTYYSTEPLNTIECSNITSYFQESKVFTAKEFMELLNKPEEEILPEEWIIEFESTYADCPFKQEFIKWVNDKYSMDYQGVCKFYYTLNLAVSCVDERPNTNINNIYKAEEFVTKFIRKEKQMEKEIIGYKLIKTQYREQALAISETYVNWENSLEEFDISVTQKQYIERLTDAGVLDIWFEPCHKQEEEELKVGDLVRLIELNNNLIGRITHSDEPKKNYQVDTQSNVAWFSNKQLKKLTKKEEAEWLTVKLPDSPYKFIVSKDYVTIEGTRYSKEYLQAALIVSKQIKSAVIIGCDAKNTVSDIVRHKWHLTTETIEELLKRMI